MMKKYMQKWVRFGWGVLALLLLQLAALQFVQAQQTGADFDHSATGFVLNAQHQNVRCETCHTKGQFKGTPTTCEACHGWNNPRAATVMPTTHIPTRNAPCESCHQSNMSQFQDALRVFSHVSVPAMSCLNCHSANNPHPGVRTNPSDATHTKVLSNNTACGACHTTLAFEGPKLPSNHIPTAAVACTNCHVSGDFSVMPSITTIHANAPSTTGNCAQCHSSAAAAAFAMPTMSPALVGTPSNHIAMNGQSCEVCHVGAGSSLQLPVTDGAKFANSRFNHVGISTGCANCHGPNVSPTSFAGISNIVRMPDSSSPGALSHIPSSTNCEACHAGSMPSGQVNANATATVPGTGFQNPKPGKDMVHAGVSSGCASCHDTGMLWVGMQLYPMAAYTGFQTRPQVAAGTFNAADQFHPSKGDCSQCHTGISFDPAQIKRPSNHIPSSNTCSNCHKDPGGDYSVMPALADIHANIPGGVACADCHSATNAARYVMTPALKGPGDHISMSSLGCEGCHVGAGSSIPSGVVGNGSSFANSAFNHSGATASCASCHGNGATTYYGLVPKNPGSTHMPFLGTVGCDVCHVNSVPSGLVPATGAAGNMKTFAGARFLHSATNATCETCHGQNVNPSTFLGNPVITVMPQSSIPGPGAHIPTAAACDSCHLSAPTNLLNGSGANTGLSSSFTSPLPTTANIHANVNGTCASCHESGMSWVGVNLYPRSAQTTYQVGVTYTGFQTRPTVSGSTYSVSDSTPHPATGDCSNCHSGYTGFAAPALPSNHIPIAAVGCAACHQGNAYSVMPAIGDIHANAQGGLTCADCHSTAKAALYPMNPAIVSPPADHIGMGTLGCEACHVGTGSSMPAGTVLATVSNGASFANSAFNHSGMNTSCASCHGVGAAVFKGVTPKNIASLSPAHMPVLSSVACDTCHVGSVPVGLVPSTGATGNMKTFAGASFLHSGTSASCATCHGQNINSNSFAGNPTLIVMPSSSTASASSHIPTLAACDSCHKGITPSGLIPGNTSAAIGSSGFKASPPLTADIHSNSSAICSSCHERDMVWLGVDLYARTSAITGSPSTVYTGFQTRPYAGGTNYSLNNSHPAAGECSTCHSLASGFTAAPLPANHIPTSANCSNCHTNSNYSVMPAVGAIHANAQAGTSCAQCHANASTYPMTPPIVTPPGNHIAMNGLGCEVCHVGSNSSLPAGTVLATVPNGASFANSAFSHSGISTGCANCHGASAGTFYGVTPLKISSLTPAHMPVLSNVACETCHVSNVPSMLIALTGASGSDTTFAGAKFTHSGTNASCATCHGQGVGTGSFAGNPTITVMPQSSVPGTNAHIPSTAACDACHKTAPSGLINGSGVNTGLTSTFLSPLPTPADIHANGSGTCSTCHESGRVWVGVNLYPRTAQTSYVAGVTYTGFQTRPTLAGSTYSVIDTTPHPAAGECSNCHTSYASGFGAPTKPSTHIPTTAGCGACHKNADYSVMPGLTDIHANAQSGLACVACHSTANAAKYPMTPALVSPPGNHVPMGALGCEACHVGSGSSMASTTVVDGANFAGSLFSHSGISSGCDTCHGMGISSSTFYGVVPKALSNLSPAHMPTTAACETCHTGGAPTVLTPASGVSFAGANFSHTGITSGCANCHGPTIIPASFAGSPNIVVMPTTGAAGAVHIPSSVNCESCHLGSTPTTLIAGSATKLVGPGTRFQSPAPTSSMIHANSDTSSCNTCHETGRNWIGMTLYPGSPTTYVQGATYTGFQTRPNSAGGGFSVQDGNHTQNGDCMTCHTGFAGFGTPTPPAGHIPTASNASCGSCHTSADFTGTVSLTNIHRWAPSQTTNCAQCHSSTNAAQYKLKYASVPVITSPPLDHIPMGTLGCEGCHVGTGSSISATPVVNGALFSNSKFSHTGMDKPCSYCHGINVDATTYTGLPSIKTLKYGIGANSHMPVSSQLGCETCHVNSVPTGLVPDAAAKTFANAQFSHTGISTDCANCHGPSISASSFMGGGGIVVMPPADNIGGATKHIPSSTTCESCHLGSMPGGLVSGTAAQLTGPGTKFRSPAPSSAAIHSNSNVASCETCHGSGKSWIGMDMYPSTPARNLAPVSGTVYTGFQTRPGGGGSFAVADATHTTSEVCANCHTSFTGFGPPSMPSTHIPVNGTAICSNCHTSANFATMPLLSNIHRYAPSSTVNCAQCHSAPNAELYPMTPPLKAADLTHMPMGSLGCESCHVDSVTGLTTNNTPTFAGSKFSHSGVTSGCAACHASGTGPWQGTNISIRTVNTTTTGSPGPTAHLPTSTTCENCHLGSTPSTLLAANASTNGFAAPTPTATMIHNGATTCNSCHETNTAGTSADVWMGMAAYPATTTAPFKGFQIRPTGVATSTFRVQDAAHPTGGDCSSCHASFTDFASTVKPNNHIPTAAVACTNCHTTSNYATMPTLTAIHANAPSTTTNCAQCHSAANAATYNQLAGMNNALVSPNANHVAMGTLGCENCHVTGAVTSSLSLPVQNGANFRNAAYSHSGVTSGCASCHGDLTTPRTFTGQSAQVLTPKAMPAAHVPNTGNVGCEVCHTTVPSGLIPFTGATTTANTFAADKKYSHKGITSSCSTCHQGAPAFTGISNLVVLPATTTGNHIPSSIAIPSSQCEACHLGSTPSALLGVTGSPRAVGNTGFLSPLPTGAMIHNGVTSGCNTCHENPYTWLGAGLYPRSPTTKVTGATYVGFQTRPVAAAAGPGTYSVTDAAHPTSGDCSQCHGSTTSFTVSAMPSNHIPVSASSTCDACHTNINLSGGNADFSQMPTLTNIHRWAPSQTANCAQCHSDTNAAKYANASVGLVIKSPASIARHVPIGTVACEVCHVVSGPVVNGATFAGGKYSHTGVTTGCADCHGNNRPANYFTGISNLVAIPVTAAMGSTSHIPYTAACEACHGGSTPSGLSSVTGTPAAVSGFRLPAPTGTMIHNGVTSNCNDCHETNYVWKGVDLYPINPKLKTAGASYKGFQTRPITTPATAYGIPDTAHPTGGDCSMCHTGTTAFTAGAMPAGHMPTTTSTCSTCHSSDYSAAGLSTLTNLHTGIKTGMVTYTAATIGTKTCNTCHTVGTGGTSGTAPFAGCATAVNCPAPPPLNAYQPKLKDAGGTVNHVPTGNLDCNGCHAAVSPSFLLTNMMKNQTMHDNVKLAGVLCKDCHENGMSWTGVTGLKVRVPSKHTSTARKAPNNCDNAGCHANSTVSNGFRMLAMPMMREALTSPDMGRIRPNLPGTKPSRGTLGNTFDHKGVQVGQCKTCHDGKSASGMPARHLMVNTSCDTCHRATTWTPAQFSHNGITPNTCQACHNGMGASAKPAGHFMTARSCDSCHKNNGWNPVNYQHFSPSYKAAPDMLTCVGCHVTNGEIIPKQMRGLNRTKPIPVSP